MAAVAIAPEWTIVDDVIAHSCGLGFDSEVVKKAKFTPFPRKVLAMALLERLSLESVVAALAVCGVRDVVSSLLCSPLVVKRRNCLPQLDPLKW